MKTLQEQVEDAISRAAEIGGESTGLPSFRHSKESNCIEVYIELDNPQGMHIGLSTQLKSKLVAEEVMKELMDLYPELFV